MKRKRLSARRRAFTGALILALLGTMAGPANGAEDALIEPIPLEQIEPRSTSRAGADQGLEITSLKVTEFNPGASGECGQQVGGAPLLCWNGNFVLRMEFRLTGTPRAGTEYTIEPSTAYAFSQNPGYNHPIVSSAGVEYGHLSYQAGRHNGQSGQATLKLTDAVEQSHGITGYVAFSMRGSYALDGGNSMGARPLGLTVAGQYHSAGATYYIQAPSRGTSLFAAPNLSVDGKPTIIVAGGVVANQRPPGDAVTLIGQAPPGTAFSCVEDQLEGISATAYSAPGNASARTVVPSTVNCSPTQVQATVSGLSSVDDVVVRATATAEQWDHEYKFPMAITVGQNYLRQDVTQKTLAYDYGALGGNFAFRKEVKQVEDTNNNGLVGDAGDTITYRFRVENTGEIELQQILLTDALLGIDRDNCLTTPLAPGNSAQCRALYKHEITSADAKKGEVVNQATATVVLPGGDDGPSRQAQTKTPTVVARPALTVIKSVERVEDTNENGTLGDAGDTVYFKIAVTNTGNTNFARVDLDDPLLNIEGNLCTEKLTAGQTAQCAGEYSYRVTADDEAEGKFVNVAIATAVNPDGTKGPKVTGDVEVETLTPPEPVVPEVDEPEQPKPQPKAVPKLAQTGSLLSVPLGVLLGISMLAGLVILFARRFFRQ